MYCADLTLFGNCLVTALCCLSKSVLVTPAMHSPGADDVTQLKELDEDEFRQLCLMVGMASKPFHVKRLQKALGRPSSQVYSQKKIGSNDQGNFPHPPPAPLPSNLSRTNRLFPTAPNPRGAPPPVSRQKVPSQPHLPLVASVTPPHPSCTQHYQQPVQKQYQQQQQQQQQQQRQQHEVMTAGYRASAFSPDSEPTNSSPSFCQTRKQLFLPHYLLPDSDSKDISPLVDELTPIQAELGPCPFKPADWDERRSELVRRYAAIYGQAYSKRKNEELSLHEENINVAAFQLCLRDPTLLVRREELLVLCRKAIKDGGYMFQHGVSKSKVAETAFVGGARKRPLEKSPSLEESFVGKNIDIAGSGIPLPRNMSREKKLKRVEELEFLIAKNKMKQSVKLTALEKARQGNDFSMSYHLQAEIESLGSTLANLQDEYANMKYRLRRSDRYFENKQKKDQEVTEAREPLVPIHQPDHLPTLEVVPKRIRIQPCLESSETQSQQFTGSANHQPAFYPAPADSPQRLPTCMHSSPTRSSSDDPQGSPPTCIQVDSSVPSSAINTSASQSQAPATITTSSTSTLSHPPPSTSPSLITSPPALLHVSSSPNPPPPSSSSSSSHLGSDLFPQHYPETTASGQYLNSRPTVMAQVLPQHDSTAQPDNQHQVSDVAEDDISSNQLLANINKLATQAAANLRSLPHF